MCSSLTDQVRSIAIVTTAVAWEDLTQKTLSPLSKGTVNSMVDQLSAFASEVTQVALEVRAQGILGGQAKVEGVQGTWADLTRNVNIHFLVLLTLLTHLVLLLLQRMASNLSNQVRSISEVTKLLHSEIWASKSTSMSRARCFSLQLAERKRGSCWLLLIPQSCFLQMSLSAAKEAPSSQTTTFHVITLLSDPRNSSLKYYR